MYQVRIAGKRGLLYVLFEHQSTPDDVMPLRLLSYLVRILELEVRTRGDAHEAVLPLPVVLPVVLHHCAQGWTRAAEFSELFDSELLLVPEIARCVPRFEFVLDDLSHLTDEALRRRTLDQVSSLTLWALRDARTPALCANVAETVTPRKITVVIEQGETQGREEACRSVLRQLLVVKFGALEATVSERIARAAEQELTAWTTRVLTASSIDEVFSS